MEDTVEHEKLLSKYVPLEFEDEIYGLARELNPAPPLGRSDLVRTVTQLSDQPRQVLVIV